MRLPSITLLLFLLSPPIHAQAPAPPPTTPPHPFEVASVRLAENHNDELLAKGIQPMSWSTFPTGRFFAHNVTLTILLSLAYNVENKYISGAPGWTDTQLYNVDAKTEGEQQLTYEQMQPLLQNLLAERLHLAAHRKTELTSGFDLVVARNGPRLPPPETNPNPRAAILSNGIQTWGTEIKALCNVLAHPAGKPVADKTGLTGAYDIKLSYAQPNDPTSPLPDFFTALQEQLGLKLVPAKVPIETLIIDHLDRTPTDN